MNLAEQFIQEVVTGEKLFCKSVKMAVQKHVADLKRAKTRKFDYYFDVEEGERALKFFQFLRHTKGEAADKKFNLQPFQAFIIYSVFGWRNKRSKMRRFRKVYIEIARKNGKTELAAGVALFTAFFDNEKGAEVYFAATKREQAKVGFDATKYMAQCAKRDSPRINGLIEFYQRTVFSKKLNSKIEFLAADANTLDGPNPHCAIVDEYHAHKTDALLKVLETGMGSRRQPLLFVITTAGSNRHSPCFKLREVCLDILRGKKQDETVFSMIFSLDEKLDWKDKQNWKMANPNLGITPYEEYMDSQFMKAKNEGYSAEIEFRTKNLNEWTNTNATWLSDEDWMRHASEIDREELRGRICYGGLDLASTRDLSAFVLIFPPRFEGEKAQVLCWFWCPEDGAKQRSFSDGVDYLSWGADELLTLTSGNVTDYSYIKSEVLRIASEFDLQSIAYDRYNASQLVIDLTDEGLEMQPFGQGFISMNAPCRELERMILAGELDHGGNPILRWMAGNVSLKTDEAGNFKIDKKQSKEKVDGMVALAMAIGQMMTCEKPDGDFYDEHAGLVVIK
jgi:phage terminase large subunit-like protein